MTLITKKFETYVSTRNLALSLGEVHYSLGKMSISCPKKQLKLFFPWGTIMSQGRRSLNWPMEQLKPFFPWGPIISPMNKCVPDEHMCSNFYLTITFAYEF